MLPERSARFVESLPVNLNARRRIRLPPRSAIIDRTELGRMARIWHVPSKDDPTLGQAGFDNGTNQMAVHRFPSAAQALDADTLAARMERLRSDASMLAAE